MKYFLLRFGSLTTLLITCMLMATAQNSASTEQLITTTGIGKVTAEPDEVHFTISLETEGEDLTDAKLQNSKLAKQAILKLREHGVEDKHIQTQYLNVRAQYYNREKRNPRYIATQSIQVCLKEVNSFEELNIALLKAGITGISGPSFKTSAADSLRDEAKILAVKDAKRKAVLLAGALEQNVGSAHQIAEHKTTNGGNLVYARSLAMESMDSGNNDGIAVGEIQIREEVIVSFYLQD